MGSEVIVRSHVGDEENTAAVFDLFAPPQKNTLFFRTKKEINDLKHHVTQTTRSHGCVSVCWDLHSFMEHLRTNSRHAVTFS